MTKEVYPQKEADGDTVQAVAKTVQGKLFDNWEITFGGKAVTLADIGLKEADLKTLPAKSYSKDATRQLYTLKFWNK